MVALAPLFVIAIVLGSRSVAAQEARKHEEKPEKQSAVPKRVLTASQKSAMKAIKTEADKKAAPLALRFAGIVKQIYENMLADQPDEKLGIQLGDDMKNITWELLTIKGQAIRDTVKLLDPEQKKMLRQSMAKPGAPSDLTELIEQLF